MKISNIKFHENCRLGADLFHAQTDVEADMAKLFATLRTPLQGVPQMSVLDVLHMHCSFRFAHNAYSDIADTKLVYLYSLSSERT